MSNESINQWMDAESVRALAEGLMRPANEEPKETQDAIFGGGFIGFAELGIDPVPSPTPAVRPPVAGPGTLPAPAPLQPASATPPVRSKLDLAAPFSIADSSLSGIPATGGETPPSPVAEPTPGVWSQPQPVEITPREIDIAPAPVTPPMPVAPPVPIVRFRSPFTIAPLPAQASAPVRETPRSAPEEQPFAKRLESFGHWLKTKVPAESYFVSDGEGRVLVDEVGSEKLIKVARTLARASTGGGRDSLPGLHVKVGADRVMEVIPRLSFSGPVILGIIVPRPLSRETVAAITKVFGETLSGKSSTPGQ